MKLLNKLIWLIVPIFIIVIALTDAYYKEEQTEEKKECDVSRCIFFPSDFVNIDYTDYYLYIDRKYSDCLDYSDKDDIIFMKCMGLI